MAMLRRSLSAVMTAAILLGAVVLVLVLRRAEPPTPQGGVASAPEATPAGYPAPPPPPPADVPPLPTAEPVPTYTLPPIVQTADALMALPTETPLPTPTATPLPTAVPTLEDDWSVMLFAGTAPPRDEPVILRLAVNSEGQPTADADVLDVSYLNSPRYRIYGMVPSPDDSRILIQWGYGDASSGTSVLDLSTGILGPNLMPGESPSVKAWHPDSERVLAQLYFGVTPQEPFLLDIGTGEQEALPPPKEELGTWALSSGSFSPDGSQVVLAYTKSDGRSTRSEVWRCVLGGACDLLVETGTDLVDHVSWSPRGEWIAVQQYTPPSADSAQWDRVGQLWLYRADGQERIDVGTALVAGGKALAPEWSHRGDHLAYLFGQQVQEDERLVLESNIRLWNAQTREVSIPTDQTDSDVRSLTWAPDDRSLLYLEAPSHAEGEFALFRLPLATAQAHEVVPARGLPIQLGAYSTVLWLTSKEVQ